MQHYLERLQQQHAKWSLWIPGMFSGVIWTTIDFAGAIDGEPFSGGTGTDYNLEIGSGAFIPGFEDQLIGAELGRKGKSKRLS